METGSSFVDRSRNHSQEYGTEDDGFSIEPRTFNFARIFRMFCRSRNLFSPKMKHKFHAICIFIDTSDATPLPFPIVKAIFISAMMLDTTRRAEFCLFFARITSFSHLIESAASTQSSLSR